MKILLISPGTPEEIDNKIVRAIPYLFVKAFIAPHAVATVAALTPPEHDVTIHDEYIRGPVELVLLDKVYDIIGISITSNQLKRSLAIAGHCKRISPGSLVVVGGIGVEILLNKNKDNIDVVFHGEAEDTWPLFLEDYKKGNWKHVYKNVSKPDMTKAPAPRWELIKSDINYYNAVSIQTTRGCPFDCSFCDVIYTYGRKPRSKTIDQVVAEVQKLHDLNVRVIFMADDNFTGDVKYAKELLKRLIDLNNTFQNPITYFTQLDITIANDDELLKLLADANFLNLMIGVESVSSDSLKDMNKKQNLNISPVEAIKKIQSYGMVVLVHMIIGADSDDHTVFQKTADFISDANVIFHICHPLAAPPGTKMWYDLKRQGRLIVTDHDETSDKMDIITNIVPKQMTRIELLEGLASYWEDIYTSDKFLKRALGYLEGIKYSPQIKSVGFKETLQIMKLLYKVLKYYLFEVEKVHRTGFFTLLRSAKNLSVMFPKITFIYTFYLIDYRRSTYDAAEARKHANWERENPKKIVIDDTTMPISQNIREHALQLCGTAYQRVREKTAEKEVVYQTVVSAILDFSDRFSKTFETFDDYHREQIINSCDRLLFQMEVQPKQTAHQLPDSPPPGFTREIMDALDNALRYRNMYN
jgi:radical SAM superfamily enzyme YgiQ (UPF0313 family)